MWPALHRKTGIVFCKKYTTFLIGHCRQLLQFCAHSFFFFNCNELAPKPPPSWKLLHCFKPNTRKAKVFLYCIGSYLKGWEGAQGQEVVTRLQHREQKDKTMQQKVEMGTWIEEHVSFLKENRYYIKSYWDLKDSKPANGLESTAGVAGHESQLESLLVRCILSKTKQH